MNITDFNDLTLAVNRVRNLLKQAMNAPTKRTQKRGIPTIGVPPFSVLRRTYSIAIGP